MALKRSTEETNSMDNQHLNEGRASHKEQSFFEVLIKKESVFLPKWKKRLAIIMYIPGSELSLTIKVKDKKTVEEVIDLQASKVSKRCSMIQNHHCFGFQALNGKRYLMSRETETKTLVMFNNLTRLRHYIKQTKPMQPGTPTKTGGKSSEGKLQFQKSDILGEQRTEEKRGELKPNRKQTLQHVQHGESKPFTFYDDGVKQTPVFMQEQQDYDDYCTVMEQEPIVIPEQTPKLHLKLPISSEEMSYLESDQNFKLIQNFNQGRLLQRNHKFIKVNLLLRTFLGQEELLQSFFHCQLWNDRVRKYHLINRIDEGIYLVYVEFHKMGLFSYPKYCYLMVTSLMLQDQHYLIFKSMQKDSFEVSAGYQWIDMSMWVKLRGMDSENNQKFMSVCMKIQKEETFSTGLAFMGQIKSYQSFLFTTCKLPHRVLEWRTIARGEQQE